MRRALRRDKGDSQSQSQSLLSMLPAPSVALSLDIADDSFTMNQSYDSQTFRQSGSQKLTDVSLIDTRLCFVRLYCC